MHAIHEVRTSPSDGTVVVLERGAPWPARFLRTSVAQLAVFHQDERESHAELAIRAVRGLDTIESRQVRIRRAALSCGVAAEPEASVGRLRIASALVEALARHDGPALLAIIARAPAAATHREALVSLVEELSDALLGSSVCVALRLEPRWGSLREVVARHAG